MQFVTQSYYDELFGKIAKLRDELNFIRSEQSLAWEHCGDGWHDNPYYSHLISQERMCLKQLDDLLAQMSDSAIVEEPDTHNDTRCIALYTRLVVRERNLKTKAERVREISIVPIGAESFSANAIPYNSPYARGLLGARIGDTAEVKIPSGEFEVTVMEIKRI